MAASPGLICNARKACKNDEKAGVGSKTQKGEKPGKGAQTGKKKNWAPGAQWTVCAGGGLTRIVGWQVEIHTDRGESRKDQR